MVSNTPCLNRVRHNSLRSERSNSHDQACEWKNRPPRGWAPPARFGPGPALHLENLGSWAVNNGTYSISGTAHIDLFNPDIGFVGILGHSGVDYIWGHIVQFFGGNIDPTQCPF